MRAVLIGAVESTRIALGCLAAAPGWDLAGVVTLPLALAGRHSDFVDLAPDTEAVGCPLLRVANSNADEALQEIAVLKPDHLFVIGWSQLCSERLRSLVANRVVGYHPAPLPRLRGRGVIPWTILMGEPITAGTLFLIDEGTDSGPILAQRFFHVAPGETAMTLYNRHMEALASMLPPLLAEMAAGTATPREQDPRYATWATRRRPEDGEIDWRGSAADAWRLVRACGDPYPGAFTMLADARIVIVAAEPVEVPQHRAALAGQVVERDTRSFTVRCGDGMGLRIDAWRSDSDNPPPLHAKLGFAVRRTP